MSIPKAARTHGLLIAAVAVLLIVFVVAGWAEHWWADVRGLKDFDGSVALVAAGVVTQTVLALAVFAQIRHSREAAGAARDSAKLQRRDVLTNQRPFLVLAANDDWDIIGGSVEYNVMNIGRGHAVAVRLAFHGIGTDGLQDLYLQYTQAVPVLAPSDRVPVKLPLPASLQDLTKAGRIWSVHLTTCDIYGNPLWFTQRTGTIVEPKIAEALPSEWTEAQSNSRRFIDCAEQPRA